MILFQLESKMGVTLPIFRFTGVRSIYQYMIKHFYDDMTFLSLPTNLKNPAKKALTVSPTGAMMSPRGGSFPCKIAQKNRLHLYCRLGKR